MARSLNKVELIGNLTRDPELRYTPQGTAVCSFGLATNRSWVTDSGEKKDEAEFHRLVAWNKLAELCSQLLSKGRKIYIEGRLSNRSWTGQDGVQRNITEIIVSDMIILDSRKDAGEGTHESGQEFSEPAQPAPKAQAADEPADEDEEVSEHQVSKQSETAVAKKAKKVEPSDDVNPDDIPF